MGEWRSEVVVASGPEAAQQALWAWLTELVPPALPLDQQWATPVRVIVPSLPLRRHIQDELVRRRGGAVVGVVVQTLYALAREILEKARQPVGVVGEALLPVMVERFSRGEAPLADLAAFEGGFLALASPVRDLLDAGLEAAHVEAVEELLGQLPGEDGARAAAVVRVAARTALALEAEGVARPTDILVRAAAAVGRREVVLPPGQVLVYGFADATGLAADLLEALVRAGATLILDLPPNPADRRRFDWSAPFTARLRERLGGASAVAAPAPPPRPVVLTAFVGNDVEEEARGVARRVRELLDLGARPEGIGVVAREAGPYRDPLGRQLGRFAVPWSAVGVAGPWAPWARQVRCTLEVVRRGEGAPIATFLDAGEGQSPLLELGLVSAGVRDLDQLAGLAVVRPFRVTLPGGEEERGRHRLVDEAEVREARRRAREVGALLGLGGEPATWGSWEAWLSEFPSALAWDGRGEAAGAWEGLLEEVGTQLPKGTLLRREEVCLLLEQCADEVLRVDGGGRGGGVVVAPVMAVRGWRWEHLFLVGCNRGVFPRRGQQDPLLPDRVRAALQPLLPDLPLKGDTSAEERYLFAQLCAAASALTLSWRRQGERGEPLAPSPLLAALGLPGQGVAGVDEGGRNAIPALDAARQMGLVGDEAAFLELWRRVGPGKSDAVAEVRLRVAKEHDRLWVAEAHQNPLAILGPYLGFVGPAALQGRKLSVSLLENLARCPWQAFVTKVLQVEPLVGWEGEVEELHAGLIGAAAHRALDQLLRPRVAAEGADLLPPPSESEVVEAARAAVKEVALEEGLAPEAAALAAPRVEALLRVAWEHLWAVDPPMSVIGVEVDRELPVRLHGAEWRVKFRVDLVEALREGQRLTDFKTGRNPFGQKSPSAITKAYLAGVKRGERLQAALYAVASGGVGRLFYLRPEQDPEQGREVVVTAGEASSSLTPVLEVLTLLWASGVMFPRLESARDGKEPPACQWCQVRDACLRGDSGARRRLSAGAGRIGPGVLPAAVFGAVAVALGRGWFLPCGVVAAPSLSEEVGGEVFLASREPAGVCSE